MRNFKSFALILYCRHVPLEDNSVGLAIPDSVCTERAVGINRVGICSGIDSVCTERADGINRVGNCSGIDSVCTERAVGINRVGNCSGIDSVCTERAVGINRLGICSGIRWNNFKQLLHCEYVICRFAQLQTQLTCSTNKNWLPYNWAIVLKVAVKPINQSKIYKTLLFFISEIWQAFDLMWVNVIKMAKYFRII